MQVGHFQLTWTVHIPKPAFMRALLILFLSCYFIHFFFFFPISLVNSSICKTSLDGTKIRPNPFIFGHENSALASKFSSKHGLKTKNSNPIWKVTYSPCQVAWGSLADKVSTFFYSYGKSGQVRLSYYDSKYKLLIGSGCLTTSRTPCMSLERYSLKWVCR